MQAIVGSRYGRLDVVPEREDKAQHNQRYADRGENERDGQNPANQGHRPHAEVEIKGLRRSLTDVGVVLLQEPHEERPDEGDPPCGDHPGDDGRQVGKHRPRAILWSGGSRNEVVAVWVLIVVSHAFIIDNPRKASKGELAPAAGRVLDHGRAG